MGETSVFKSGFTHFFQLFNDFLLILGEIFLFLLISAWFFRFCGLF